ncbi:choice-of-anchor B family protein [Planctomycetota bacterium]
MVSRSFFAGNCPGRVFQLWLIWVPLSAFVPALSIAHDVGKGNLPILADTPLPENLDAFGFTGENVTVISHLPMSELGGKDPVSDRNNSGKANGSDLWGWTDPETNREYALFGRSDTVSFVDITDAANPAFLGMLPTHSLNRLYRDVKTYQNYAYVVADVSGHGMQVFDLTRLRGVTEQPNDFWVADSHYDGFGGAHNIVINPESGFAIAVGSDTFNGGMHFIDLQNPLDPKPLGGVQSLGYTHDAQAVTYRGPDSDYVGHEIVFAYTVDSMSIVDANNPAEPAVLSNTGYDGHRYAHQGWVTDDHRFALMNDELDELQLKQNARTHIWNIEDLDEPVYLGYYEASSQFTDHNLYVKDGLVYEANYLGGLRVLDISNIENGKLTEVAWLDTQPQIDSPYFSGLWSVYPYFESSSIIMSDMVKGLIVAEVNHDAITIVGDFDGDRELKASDLDVLLQAVRERSNDQQFDINNDGQVSGIDGRFWVRDIFGSTAGDADLNGTFDSRDLVRVFQTSEYEDGILANSTWADGDWNGDLEFSSADLVVAFQDRGYEQAVVAVPEPTLAWLGLGAAFLSVLHRRR